MKITDAYWEKRNLGITCTEIIIENGDQLSHLEEINDVLECVEYVVVKVPSARFEMNNYLTQKRFVFIEGSINLYLDLKDAVLTTLQQRLNGVVTYAEMDEVDLSQLYYEIERGMFKSDRILLDDFFTEKQAAARYINWIKDELAKSTQAYKMVYKDDPIGFFTFREVEKNIFYPFLAGMYKKYASSGLGFETVRKPIEEAIKRGGHTIHTYISTNNTAVFRVHIQQGFSVHEMQYVFVKHNK
ncbi:hypothetical protein ER57_18330 [Smithella sp. SCADC]|jgi:hypothetical protein|nr:hypothetical protein ER57_18330 [Smithella sp. SCADC]